MFLRRGAESGVKNNKNRSDQHKKARRRLFFDQNMKIYEKKEKIKNKIINESK